MIHRRKARENVPRHLEQPPKLFCALLHTSAPSCALLRPPATSRNLPSALFSLPPTSYNFLLLLTLPSKHFHCLPKPPAPFHALPCPPTSSRAPYNAIQKAVLCHFTPSCTIPRPPAPLLRPSRVLPRPPAPSRVLMCPPAPSFPTSLPSRIPLRTLPCFPGMNHSESDEIILRVMRSFSE